MNVSKETQYSQYKTRFYPEDGGGRLNRNAGIYQSIGCHIPEDSNVNVCHSVIQNV